MKVFCPSCRNFVVKASFEGTAEVNCGNKRCGAVLEITMKSGNPTVTVIAASNKA